MIHRINRRQVVGATLQECWEFFSNPANLARITPPSLDFRVVGELPSRMRAGMMIEYRVRPLFGIPVTWLTEITHVEEQYYFVDEQRVGPYRIWHHEHEFREAGSGRTEVIDRVTYQLPVSPFSEVVHPVLVAPQLAAIFAFREQAAAKLFPCKPDASSASG